MTPVSSSCITGMCHSSCQFCDCLAMQNGLEWIFLDFAYSLANTSSNKYVALQFSLHVPSL